MHQRRLAGAVVADEAEAFAGGDGEVDAGKRADGAETLFDAVQLTIAALAVHRPTVARQPRPLAYVIRCRR